MKIHSELISQTGGYEELRDEKLLEWIYAHEKEKYLKKSPTFRRSIFQWGLLWTEKIFPGGNSYPQSTITTNVL